MKLLGFCVLLGLAAAAPATTHSARASSNNTLEDYEYVVVGSGPGGGTLAARLAMAGKKTLLIDAGDDQGENINYRVPALQGKSTEDPLLRWDYFVNHYSDSSRALRDNKMEWRTPSGSIYTGQNPPQGSEMLGILYPRAGTLGGCGSHNALITIYPADSDWNNIASLTGDSSWSASNMRTYFEKMEKCEYLANSVVGHGFDGWLQVSEADVKIVAEDFKIFQQLVGAAASIGKGIAGGITTIAQLLNVLAVDPNGDTPSRDSTTGVFQIPLTMRASDATRNGPRDFVNDIASAKNADGTKQYPLDIRLNCLVTKVVFSNDTIPKATGVEFLDGQSLYWADPRSSKTGGTGTPGSVSATMEVILAAGAFNTPQLLKLSGVGPASELQSFNIPVVKNVPGVGTNLQDRYESGVTGYTPQPFAALQGCTFGNGSDPCITRWQDDVLDRGAYGSNGFGAAIITRSSVAADSNNDLFIFGGPVSFHGYYEGYADDAIRDHDHWTWAILKAHTGNRAGTVNLRSADPRDTPVINFNYFDTGTTAGGADTRDVQALAEGVAMARKIYQSLPLLSASYQEVLPGADVSSQGEVEQYVKDNAWGHHASCTCPIGADSDPNAVLDSKFRVRGVDNLRVVDASVFPVIPGIFIAVPVYMVGEKGADVILNG